ncbi:MAG: glycosyltransferase family 2 protein [Anaerolineales bacterium]
MTLVSIITPSFNQAAFLEATIRSVLDQDYSELEYILVDGGSTDGSLDIIHRYRDKFAWWVSEPDKGQAEAINKGLSRARGDIVAWLNSDDLYLPGAVSQAVSALQSDPRLAFVYGNAVTVDAEENNLSDLQFAPYELMDLMAFRIICQPSVFMRRSVLERAGPLDTSYRYLLDHQLWIRLACLAPFQHIPASLSVARQHPGAKNVAQAAGFGQEAFRILDWMGTQPDLAPLVKNRRRRIEGGAYRLNARYLLDGDLPGAALKSYAHAVWLNPSFALQHWHRMIYAVLSLAGGKRLSSWYYRLRRPPRTKLPQPERSPESRQDS